MTRYRRSCNALGTADQEYCSIWFAVSRARLCDERVFERDMNFGKYTERAEIFELLVCN